MEGIWLVNQTEVWRWVGKMTDYLTNSSRRRRDGPALASPAHQALTNKTNQYRFRVTLVQCQTYEVGGAYDKSFRVQTPSSRDGRYTSHVI